MQLAAVSALANWALLLLKHAESSAKAAGLGRSSREDVTSALLQVRFFSNADKQQLTFNYFLEFPQQIFID